MRRAESSCSLQRSTINASPRESDLRGANLRFVVAAVRCDALRAASARDFHVCFAQSLVLAQHCIARVMNRARLCGMREFTFGIA
jgi:hypothetical protein